MADTIQVVFSVMLFVGGGLLLAVALSQWKDTERTLKEARRFNAETRERANIAASNFYDGKELPEPVQQRIGVAMELPPNMRDTKDILHLPQGMTAYTLPWAVMTDQDMRVWINGTYPAEQSPYGTISMMIQRVEGGVVILNGMEPQRPVKGLPWVGSESADLLPVVGIGNKGYYER